MTMLSNTEDIINYYIPFYFLAKIKQIFQKYFEMHIFNHSSKHEDK